VNAVSVIPIYLPSDDVVAKYFTDHKREISAITGTTLIVFHAESVRVGDIDDVTKAIRSARFKDLRLQDLPCLQVEQSNKYFRLKLPRDKGAIGDLFRLLTDEAEDASSLEELEKIMEEKMTVPSAQPKVPRWFPVAGYAAGGFTLLFFMGLVVASMFAVVVPAGGKWAAVVVLSLGGALAFSFIGGDASAKGALPIPFMNGKPLQIILGGGAAFFVILMVLGYTTYIRA
jgi:hypothetical protein